MVACNPYFNLSVCNTHWLIWAPPPQQERLPGSEQRAEARRSGSERGHPFHRIAVGWGKRGLRRLIQVGSTTVGHPERAQRQVLQARPRQGRNLLIVRCCLQVRAGARAPPCPTGGRAAISEASSGGMSGSAVFASSSVSATKRIASMAYYRQMTARPAHLPCSLTRQSHGIVGLAYPTESWLRPAGFP